MPNTYSQLYIHVVFAVKRRENLIAGAWKEDLFRYIIAICSNHKQKVVCINGMPDHVHILINYSPDLVISDIVGQIKSSSTNWINQKKFLKVRFSWQSGFGVFSVSPRGVSKVKNYIINQENHHKRQKFREEYIDIIKTAGIVYDEKYIFEDVGKYDGDH